MPVTEPSRVGLKQAIGWVLLAGVLAHVVGGVVAMVVHTALAGAGVPPSLLGPGPAVFLPSMAASMLAIAFTAWLAPQVLGVPPRIALGLRPAPWSVYVAAAVGTIALGPTADVLMQGVAALAPDATLGALDTLERIVTATPVWLVWPFLALMPGVCEELLFRGLLQNAAGRTGVRAISISAIGFALFHLDPHHVAGVLPYGFFLAWVAARAGTLVTMFAHVVNNTMAIASVHIDALHVGHGAEAPMPPSWVPLGLALCGLSIVAIVLATRAGPGSAQGAGGTPASA